MQTQRRIKGASLIEFLIASTIGVIALGIIGGTFIQGQKLSTQRVKELNLLQSNNSVLQLLKLDLHRAGYDGINGYSLKLSGAEHTLHVVNGIDHGLVAYAYASQISGSAITYRNVAYRQQASDPDVLQICEKEQSTIMTAVQSEDFSTLVGANCNTLFHTNQITVERFDVELADLKGVSVSSAMATITLKTHLKNDSSVSQTLTMDSKQRNWQ